MAGRSLYFTFDHGMARIKARAALRPVPGAPNPRAGDVGRGRGSRGRAVAPTPALRAGMVAYERPAGEVMV